MKNCCFQTTLFLSKLGRFISEGSVECYRNLINTDFGDTSVNRAKILVLAFLRHIGECFKNSGKDNLIECATISYGDLVKKARQLALELGEEDIKIPSQGHGMGRIIGDALGLVSQATFIIYGVPISKVVVQQGQKRPGEGYNKLVSDLKVKFSNKELLFALEDIGKKMAKIL